MRMNTVRTLLVAALVTCAAPMLAVAPAAAQTPAAYETTAFGATNDQRSAYGLRELRAHTCLQRFADRQAHRMAEQRAMFHQDLGPILRRCGMTRVGENVAYGYLSGRAVVRAWMASPGHRANILDGRYRLMAIGAAQSATGTWYTSQVFGRA